MSAPQIPQIPQNQKINLAIVGSRNFTDFNKFEITVDDALKEWGLTTNHINRIVSGGAKGADTLADWYAKHNGIALTVYVPDWKAFGKAAGIMRNTDIVNDCEYLIAFPSRSGKGTQDSIKKACNSTPPKKLKVVYID